MSKKKPCISSMLLKLTGMDQKMCNMSERIQNLKDMVTEQHPPLDEDEEEECPDVAASERAMVDAIEKLYVEELLTREPEGDA